MVAIVDDIALGFVVVGGVVVLGRGIKSAINKVRKDRYRHYQYWNEIEKTKLLKELAENNKKPDQKVKIHYQDIKSLGHILPVALYQLFNKIEKGKRWPVFKKWISYRVKTNSVWRKMVAQPFATDILSSASESGVPKISEVAQLITSAKATYDDINLKINKGSSNQILQGISEKYLLGIIAGLGRGEDSNKKYQKAMAKLEESVNFLDNQDKFIYGIKVLRYQARREYLSENSPDIQKTDIQDVMLHNMQGISNYIDNIDFSKPIDIVKINVVLDDPDAPNSMPFYMAEERAYLREKNAFQIEGNLKGLEVSANETGQNSITVIKNYFSKISVEFSDVVETHLVATEKNFHKINELISKQNQLTEKVNSAYDPKDPTFESLSKLCEHWSNGSTKTLKTMTASDFDDFKEHIDHFGLKDFKLFAPELYEQFKDNNGAKASIIQALRKNLDFYKNNLPELVENKDRVDMIIGSVAETFQKSINYQKAALQGLQENEAFRNLSIEQQEKIKKQIRLSDDYISKLSNCISEHLEVDELPLKQEKINIPKFKDGITTSYNEVKKDPKNAMRKGVEIAGQILNAAEAISQNAIVQSISSHVGINFSQWNIFKKCINVVNEQLDKTDEVINNVEKIRNAIQPYANIAQTFKAVVEEDANIVDLFSNDEAQSLLVQIKRSPLVSEATSFIPKSEKNGNINDQVLDVLSTAVKTYAEASEFPTQSFTIKLGKKSVAFGDNDEVISEALLNQSAEQLIKVTESLVAKGLRPQLDKFAADVLNVSGKMEHFNRLASSIINPSSEPQQSNQKKSKP